MGSGITDRRRSIMARKVAFNTLPEWARIAIERAGTKGMTQMQSDGGSLQVQYGVARFNGILVAAKGEVVEPGDTTEETISLAELPDWAQRVIRKTAPGSMSQVATDGNTLQIASNGTVSYNGIRVIK
jgi:hypothetical protein